MPTYEYHCDHCHRNFDVVQSFHDDPLEVCPTCESPVRKVFGTVGIVFKGSGFYKNDSRSTASAKDGDGAGASDGTKKEVASSDGGTASSGSGDSAAPASAPSSKESKSTSEAAPASKSNGKSAGTKESAKT